MIHDQSSSHDVSHDNRRSMTTRMTGTRVRRPESVSLSWPPAVRMTLFPGSSPLLTSTSRTLTGSSEMQLSCLLVWQLSNHFINPWRACAARVTVLGLCVCVCLSVCLRLFSHYKQRDGLRAIPIASVQQAREK